MRANFISVTTPHLVTALIAKRAEFDKIALPAIDHGQTNPNRPLLTKTAYHGNTGEMTVVFEHWYGLMPAERIAAEMAASIRGESIVSDEPVGSAA